MTTGMVKSIFVQLISSPPALFSSFIHILRQHDFLYITRKTSSLRRLLIAVHPCHSSSELATMAKAGRMSICFLIFMIDIVAGILGIKAEIAENKGKYLRVLIFECKTPVYQAFELGLAAAGLLVLAHAVANLLGGCTCICSKEEFDKSSADRHLASLTLVLSWAVLTVGFTLLMVGAMSNSRSRRSCLFVHHHFLLIGGILCFVHGLFSVAYYVSSIAAFLEEERKKRRDQTDEVHI